MAASKWGALSGLGAGLAQWGGIKMKADMEAKLKEKELSLPARSETRTVVTANGIPEHFSVLYDGAGRELSATPLSGEAASAATQKWQQGEAERQRTAREFTRKELDWTRADEDYNERRAAATRAGIPLSEYDDYVKDKYADENRQQAHELELNEMRTRHGLELQQIGRQGAETRRNEAYRKSLDKSDTDEDMESPEDIRNDFIEQTIRDTAGELQARDAEAIWNAAVKRNGGRLPTVLQLQKIIPEYMSRIGKKPTYIPGTKAGSVRPKADDDNTIP